MVIRLKIFLILCNIFIASCSLKSGTKNYVEKFSIATEIIMNISEGGSPMKYLHKDIAADEMEKDGFVRVLTAIQEPDNFHSGSECHTNFSVCLGFSYKIPNKESLYLMYVGFIEDDHKQLEVLSYSIFTPGTWSLNSIQEIQRDQSL